MTMRRGHHTSSVLKAMGRGNDEKSPVEDEREEETAQSADIEPA